jgi:hypothetical protein
VLPDAVEKWLRRSPDMNTVPLTVLDRIKRGLPADGMLLGWLAEGDEIHGMTLHTPPHPLLLPDLPEDAARTLAPALRAQDHPVNGVSGLQAQAEAFARAWGRPEAERMSMRLYRLGTLTTPAVPGAARTARQDDEELLIEWQRAFTVEARIHGDDDPAPLIRQKIQRQEVVLWEDGGRPVSRADFTVPLAGMSRISAVYTPPSERCRGYGTAVTHAASQAALDAGAELVLLFTDLANPTSNSIYQAIGYRPVADYARILFA